MECCNFTDCNSSDDENEDKDDEILITEECNKCTRIVHDIKKKRTIYAFDYNGISLDWRILKKLKDNNQWDVIRHPYVLNYINEILIHSAMSYAIHIVTYFIFLFLFCYYIHTNFQIWNTIILTILSAVFAFASIVKIALKIQRESSCCDISIQFFAGCIFTFITYIATIVFVWFPTISNYDDYNIEIKEVISRLLPIIAIVFSWIKCLYILRKSPCGPYILMMFKILRSFMGTIFIWIPTLLCFVFLFQLVIQGSGKHPCDGMNLSDNSTTLTIIECFTKTSAMMLGEVEVNDILELRALTANLLLIFFEIVAAILLLNLMTSIAVGDVNELRKSADEDLLRIKVGYCIEALHFSEFTRCCFWTPLFKQKINNIAIVYKHENKMFTTKMEFKKRNIYPIKTVEDSHIHELRMEPESIRIIFPNVARRSILDQGRVVEVGNSVIKIKKLSNFAIAQMENTSLLKVLLKLEDKECCIKLKRWLIGINWNALLNYPVN